MWRIILAFCILLLRCSCFVYFIEQENWGIDVFWRCRGTPELKAQRVFLLEEAVATYYETLMGGRFQEDKQLDLVVPPASVLGSPLYLELIDMVLQTEEENFGNQLYMKMNCELFNNKEWVRDIFNRPLARNTVTVRAILDIIYRVALCLKNIDRHINCPDVCRSRPKDACDKATHSDKKCGSYLDEAIASVFPNLELNNSEVRKQFRNMYRQIPLQRKFPYPFFQSDLRLKNAILMQRMASRTAYCTCGMYYRYDRFLDGCVQSTDDLSCGGSNPCANGGRCFTIFLKINITAGHEIPTVKCECPPAFRGEFCEEEVDRCVEENVCGEFNCIRDPHDFDNGYRCICPPSHMRKSHFEPICVPLPACGERVEAFDSGELPVSNPLATQNPCLNRGHCVQGEDPTLYTCICQAGYSGKNCEIEPPAPVWSQWTEWSDCIWPEPYEICYRQPFQQQTRHCVTYTPGQRCVGAPRRQRYAGCDLFSDSRTSYTGITYLKRERLQKAAELCEMAGKHAHSSISEAILGEQLYSVDSIDDWSTMGMEDAPFLNLPASLRSGELQAVNWPKAEDLLFMTLWIYAVLLHLALILLWIYYIHKWRTTKYIIQE